MADKESSRINTCERDCIHDRVFQNAVVIDYWHWVAEPRVSIENELYYYQCVCLHIHPLNVPLGFNTETPNTFSFLVPIQPRIATSHQKRSLMPGFGEYHATLTALRPPSWSSFRFRCWRFRGRMGDIDQTAISTREDKPRGELSLRPRHD